MGPMETILDTYCECTSVSQKFLFSSSLGTKVYITYILSNSEHTFIRVLMDQFWKVAFTAQLANHVGGQQP